MNTLLVCLVTLLGMECAINAPAMGECQSFDSALVCYVDVEDIPLYASWYDPTLGGINCDGTCEHKALRPFDVNQYGHTAACPHDWIGQTFSAVDQSWYCDDRGGAIKLGYRPVWTADQGTHYVWAWTIDFMLPASEPAPWWAYTLISDWNLNR